VAEQILKLPDGREVPLSEVQRWLWTPGPGPFALPYIYLKHSQRLMWEILNAPSMPRLAMPFLKWARRTGKTSCEVMDFEVYARTHPESIIRFAGPTQKQVISTIIPIWNKLLRDCPPDLRAKEKIREGCWVWPNGSRLYIAGTDDQSDVDKLRGPEAHRIYVDELGFHRCDLEELIDHVLSPQLNTTGGIMVLSTTPPKSNTHPSRIFIRRAQQFDDEFGRDFMFEKNILQGMEDGKNDPQPLFTPKDVRKFCKRMNPGADATEIDLILAGKLPGSIGWRREYMVELVTDDRIRVCPDFREAEHVKPIVGKVPYATHYVLVDQGHAEDYFAALFCSHSFLEGKLYIEAEWQARRRSTDQIISALRTQEELLWGGDGEVRRSAAYDPRGGQQVTDMNKAGYRIAMASKSSGDIRVRADRVTVAVRSGMVQVSPNCRHLIAQMRDGIFEVSDSGKNEDYQRTDEEGHLDHFEALGSGTSVIDWRKNAMPVGTYVSPDFFTRGDRPQNISETAKTFQSIFREARA
jgi:hypothetical protein